MRKVRLDPVNMIFQNLDYDDYTENEDLITILNYGNLPQGWKIH